MELTYYDTLDRRAFVRNHLKPRTPFVLRGALEKWRTADIWSFEWLRDNHGHIPVYLRFPTRPGSDVSPGFALKQDTLGAFADKLVAGQSVDECGYLGSFSLASIPELDRLAVFPDFTTLDRLAGVPERMGLVGTAAWMGPAGTESMVHADVLDNVFAQVRGRKHFQFFLPSRVASAGRSQNSLLADPAQRDSPPEPDYDFVLEEGELLYIPPFYWHRVVALDPSISVNVVWYTPKTYLRDMALALRHFAGRVVRKLRSMVR